MQKGANIVVIGGGISGLACAWGLRKRNLPVVLLERAPRFGGIIGAVKRNGFHFDVGPQSMTVGGSLLTLVEELGLAGQLCHAPRRAPRYILLRGRLVAAPLGPLSLLQTPLFGWKTKLRLLGEPFGHSHPPADDESIADFVRRKFGQDLLENVAAPVISGIYAGDTEKLSLRSTFPRLREFEERSGSLVRGALRARRERAKARPGSAAAGGAGAAGTERGAASTPRATLSNFRGGLVTLTDALAASLGDAARAGAEVLEIRRGGPEKGSAAGAEFEVAFRKGGAVQSLSAAAVVLATPTAQVTHLLAGIDPLMTEALGGIEYAPVAQVSAGYRLKDLAPPGAERSGDDLSGFGFLVPQGEGLQLLGTVWNSSLFPGRVPEGAEKMAAFTSFLGGATNPDIVKRGEEEIMQIARQELGAVLHAGSPPVAEYVARWERAIPQYNLGHGRTVSTLAELCGNRPGIFLTGNYLSGPSIPACIEHANRIAEDVARWVSR